MTDQAKDTAVIDNDFLPTIEVFEGKVFPHMTVAQFKLAKIEDTVSKKSGKRMLAVSYVCTAPEPYTNLWHNEYFVIGKDVDENDASVAMQIDPDSKGYKKFTTMRTSADIVGINSLTELIANISLAKPQLIITVGKEVQDKGPYAGKENNFTLAYAKVGAKELGVQGAKGTKGVSKPAGTASQTKIKCRDCGEMVLATEFAAHMKVCPVRNQKA